ncbi:MAG: nucleoside-diphosphate sugar epimerase/dehydratase [Sulfurisoma sp.]|nr:nucleoside-diphosphate sugar epimerase/dehydratase [Sulfurisoma sp.]
MAHVFQAMKPRAFLVFLHDSAMAVAAWVGAYWLRFNLDIPERYWGSLIESLPPVVFAQSSLFLVFGLYRGMWRFASLPDLKRILVAVSLGALVAPALLFMLSRLNDVPRSVLLLAPLLLALMMGGSRLLYRAWKDGHLLSIGAVAGEPVLVLGAGAAAATLLRDLQRGRDWHVVGLLDDDPAKLGSHLNGVSVLGGIAECGYLAGKLGVRQVIIAMPSATPAARRRAAEHAVAAGLGVLTVPSFGDLLAGRVSVSNVRGVELEDLLGRDQIQLDDKGLHQLLAGKTILVTGAGGSIGSELCRQILRFSPGLIVLYELSEFSLYAIDQEFSGRPVACAVGDVKDPMRLASVFAKYRPDVVFHAAAYKHVPLMENENAWEAVRNNVLGTWRVAQVAAEHDVGEFCLISTDKAVNPTNVMGASKRLAEQVCQALQAGGTATRYVAVRFGNVLGSSGSVIPKFREQIARGGPVTVTHPEIVRYFMLIPEAAQLVLQAAVQAQSGGEIFVLDMGEPVKIAQLARDMIRLSGLIEDDIGIEFTGLRPGEKLFEELLADGETTLPTPHPKLRVMKAEMAPDAAWLAELEAWLAVPVRAEAEVKAGLRRWVPEYRPARH